MQETLAAPLTTSRWDKPITYAEALELEAASRVLGEHVYDAAAAAADPKGLSELRPKLMPLMADPHILLLAWRRVVNSAIHIPGPDKLACGELSPADVKSLLATLSRQICDGRYEPGPVGIVRA